MRYLRQLLNEMICKHLTDLLTARRFFRVVAFCLDRESLITLDIRYLDTQPFQLLT